MKTGILDGAKEKVERFNRIGLHYNLVADAVYRERTRLGSPFSLQYLPYIVAALISFELERMMGDDREGRYNFETGGFGAPFARKLERIKRYLSHISKLSLPDLDIEKEGQNIMTAYEDLAEGGVNGLNRRGGEFHVGATKILHFINPDAFLIIDSNAARAFRRCHDIHFRNTTQPGYSSSNYLACMKCAQKDVSQFGVERFFDLEPGTPLCRIYDKLTFITGSDVKAAEPIL